MTELERLTTWIESNGYTTRKLATELGMSFDGVYQVLYYRKRISPGFKLRFTERFGTQIANEIFDATIVPSAEIA